MPFVYDRSLGTSVNIDSDKPVSSTTNDSAARKFAAPDISFEQSNAASIRTNEEHLIEQAAGLKGLACAAEIIADQARSELAVVRDQLSVVKGAEKGDIRSPIQFSGDVERALSDAAAANSLSDEIGKAITSIDIDHLAGDLRHRTAEIVFKKRGDLVSPSTVNDVVPQLDRISVELDKNRGAADCFFAIIKFSLPASQVSSGNVKAVRIFRSVVINPRFSRGRPTTLSMRAIERLSTSKMRSRGKGLDPLSLVERRLRESGVPNALTLLNPIDPTTNLRRSATVTDGMSTGSLNSAVPSRGQRFDPVISSFLDPHSFEGVDTSVLQDIKVISNLRSPSVGPMATQPFVLNTAEPLRRGLVNYSQVTTQVNVGLEQLVIEKNNSFGFREISFMSLEKLRASVVGDHVEYTLQDENIGYGLGYKYYVVSVNKNMIESVRSQIVDVVVDGLRVPERPKNVFVQNIESFISLNVIVEDQLVEKFEIYRREADRGLIRSRDMSSQTFADSGFNVNTTRSTRLPNGFIKIGEGLNGTGMSGASFYDRAVVPGTKYIYRVYSVDIFGNKSESPYEFNVFVPDRVAKKNELIKPTLTAEVDSTTAKARIVFKCSDSRVKNLFLSRRDVTIGQHAFSAPSEVNELKLGTPKVGEGSLHFDGSVLRGESREGSWTGFFENSTSETIFIDRTVRFDHIYQYRIYGVDIFGNSTPYEYSRPMMITRRPMIDAPINVEAHVVQGRRFTVAGVKISWHEANIDVSTEDRLGNRDSLASTSVRTLYQVERKKLGEEKWYEFPMIEQTSFFDGSSTLIGSMNPKFRPPAVESNQTYVYRVKALQTGSFVSNYSVPVEVFTSLPVVPPANFRVRASDTRVSPFYAALNWDTPNNSGVVDKWEIERCEVNNFAASRINNRNPDDLKSLEFMPFRTVFRESSRFNSEIVDADQSDRDATGLFSGQHQFQDTDMMLGNTYFYRLRAVGLDGGVSDWVYHGIKLTDQSTERLLDVMLSIDDRKTLSETRVPLLVMSPKSEGSRSFSIQPQFSKPMR